MTDGRVHQKAMLSDISERKAHNRLVRDKAVEGISSGQTLSVSALFGDDSEDLAASFLAGVSALPAGETAGEPAPGAADGVARPSEVSAVEEVLESPATLDAEDRTTKPQEPPPPSKWATIEELKRPEDIHFREQIPQMAIEYPFELDPFQKQAILHLENGESVFIAAHTSAGTRYICCRFFGGLNGYYVNRENGHCRIRHCSVGEAHDESCVYITDQDVVQSEVQGLSARGVHFTFQSAG